MFFRVSGEAIPKLLPLPSEASYATDFCVLSASLYFAYVPRKNPTFHEFILQSAVERANDSVQGLFARSSNLVEDCGVVNCTVEPKEVSRGLDSDPSSEEYSITFESGSSDCRIGCNSVYGCMHGLTTFLQLINPVVGFAIPIKTAIRDRPAFSYRGVLIDTGRRFLPVSLIRTHLDLMSAAKMNVLHWHIVDDHSFPLRVRSFPLLWQRGSYGSRAQYSWEDVRSVVEYASERGIRVVPEIDIPGHTESWMKGYPELLGIAKSAIDPTREENYEFLEVLLSEVAEMFRSEIAPVTIHLGGDETWDGWDTPAIRDWMIRHEMVQGKKDLAKYWISRISQIAKKIKVKIVLWEDFLTDLADDVSELSPEIAWEMWQRPISESEKFAVKTNTSVVFATDFYLDHLKLDWPDFYGVDMGPPASWLLGGEACMWGESVDESNFISRVWPRAAAVAERLWTNPTTPATAATSRLATWVCRMRHLFGHPTVGPVGQTRSDNPDELWTWHTEKEQWYCGEQDTMEVGVIGFVVLDG